MSNEETKLQRAIQEALCWLPGVIVWRCNAGKQKVLASCAASGKVLPGETRQRWIAYGLRDLAGKVAGTPDLIGSVDGRFLALEVKLPGRRPTPEQRARLQEIRDHGGIAEVVHSVDEAVGVVNAAIRGQALLKQAAETLQQAEDEWHDQQAKAVVAYMDGLAIAERPTADGVKQALKGASCERPKGHDGPCGMEEPGDYPALPAEAPRSAAGARVTLIIGCKEHPDEVRKIETAAEFEELTGRPPSPAWGLK